MDTHAANGISAHGLVRTFKGDIRAVDGVDLEIAPGEIYGFLGPNGAGKSTMALMLTTLLPPSEGSATVAGYDIVRDGAAVRRTIGAALQAVALDNFLTAREHLHLIAQLHGMRKTDARNRADELLTRVGLTLAADRKVGGFSGGMRRRLDLALALVHQPRVLFLDEPTTGLDPQSRSALWEEVARLSRDEGVTVFLTTQYLEEADVLAHRVGIIDSGKIVADGTPDMLKNEFGTPTIEAVPVDNTDLPRLKVVLSRFGDLTLAGPGAVAVNVATATGAVDLVEIVRAVDEADIKVSQLRQHAPSLDDVFLAKTGRHLEGAGEEPADSADPVQEPQVV